MSPPLISYFDVNYFKKKYNFKNDLWYKIELTKNKWSRLLTYLSKFFFQALHCEIKFDLEAIKQVSGPTQLHMT